MQLVVSKSKCLWGLLVLSVLIITACSEAGFNPLELMKQKNSADQEKLSPPPSKADSPHTGNGKQINLADDPSLQFEKSIVFAKRESTDLALDIAYPKIQDDSNELLPAIIYVHGGGFVAGDRFGFYPHLKKSVARGYVAVTIDYRLADGSPDKKFPAAVKDVGAAVRWLKENSATYNVDPKRIGIYGGSAGGNLVLMVGLASELVDKFPDRLYPDQNSHVKAVVNFCGPTDYAILLKSRKRADPLHIMSYLNGKKMKDLRKSAKAASPVYYVDKNDPPILTLHGTADSIVPFKSAIRLDNAIKKAGGSHELIPLEGGDHPGLSKIDYRAKLETETFRFFGEKL